MDKDGMTDEYLESQSSAIGGAVEKLDKRGVDWVVVCVVLLLMLCGLIVVYLFFQTGSSRGGEREGWTCRNGICVPTWQMAGRGGDFNIPEWKRQRDEDRLLREKIETQEKINRRLDMCEMWGNCDGITIEKESGEVSVDVEKEWWES